MTQTSLICQECDTLTMMTNCPKCDSITVPYGPRGSGRLCVGPPIPRLSSRVPSRGSRANPLALHRSCTPSRSPYEVLSRRLSPSMERQPSQEPVYHDEAELQEQLAKERDLMVQSAGDILRITEGFQIEQKKSIRVIDRLYDENQMLKQRLHLPLDSPGTWKEKYGVDVPQSMAGYMNNQNAAGAGGPRSNADKMEYFSDRLNADEALDEIERCARTVERELDELMEELGSAERIVSEETAWAQSQEQGQRQTLYSQTQFRGTY